MFADLVEHGRFLSEPIPGAQFVTFPGADMLLWAGEFDGIVDEIEEFFTGRRRSHRNERALATVLFIDIVDSTIGRRRRATASGAASSTSTTSTSTACWLATTAST